MVFDYGFVYELQKKEMKRGFLEKCCLEIEEERI